MDLTQDGFDGLLAWLHPDRDQAGRIYQDIRVRLVKEFERKGRLDAEYLADDTINRVSNKVAEIAPTYVGDPARYFFATARNVWLENNRRRPQHDELPPDNVLPAPEPEEEGPEHDCLERCLERLTPRSRTLILGFYEGEKSVKIEKRRRLAEELKTTVANLRLQACRIRAELKKCIFGCIEQTAAG